MNTQLKLFLAILSTLILVLASVFTALAGGPHWQAAAGNLVGADDGARVPAQAKCTKMEISNPSLWFATDKEGNVYADKIVKQYPNGTSYIAAGFEYNCIPKNTTVTVVYYYGGFDTEPVFTDSSKEKASAEPGTFWWYIGYDDGTPIPQGDWQVEWYINKKLASQGEITVGGGTKDDVEDIGDDTGDDEEETNIDDIWNWGDDEENGQAATVTVQGTIVDGKTKKPISGAMFIVLNPGVGAQEWVDAKFPTEDVFSAGQTDTKGKFVLSQPLERNVTYTVFVVAKGYQPIVAEDFLIDDQQEDPVDLTIKMYK
jgi:hypothetical protein